MGTIQAVLERSKDWSHAVEMRERVKKKVESIPNSARIGTMN
jgi:hypothetical protein